MARAPGLRAALAALVLLALLLRVPGEGPVDSEGPSGLAGSRAQSVEHLEH